MKLRPDEPSLLESLGNTYYNLAEVLVDLQRPETATNYYERSGKLNPNGVTSFKLGNTFSLSGDRVRAVEAYRLACQLEPGGHDFHYNLAIALLGTELERGGEHETAHAH